MEDIDFTLVLEALGYNRESIDINRHYELVANTLRDTFWRKGTINQECVGSAFEGLTFIQRFRESEPPDMDCVCNLTEMIVTPSMRSVIGCDKIKVETDLKITPCSNFPGYVYISLGQYLLSNTILQASCKTLPINNFVYCYAYKSWPDEANNWISRNKPNNWPSKELIELIKSKGFNLAPVGHYDCIEKEYQHRIGIRGEKELFLNLNETQILCYVALRLILNAEKGLIDKDVLSSFHMKNIVYWCAEQESCQWAKKNFKICLKTCINKLTEFITFGEFPHYFIENRNLINSKMTPKLKKKIVNVLTKYSSDVVAVLNLRSFDHLKNKTDNFKTTLLKHEKQRSVIVHCITFYWKTLNPVYICPNSIWEAYEGHNTANNLQNAEKILTILEKSKRNFILCHTVTAKNMLGLLSYSRYHETRCKNNKLRLKAMELLSTATFENVSLKFRVATFSFMENEFGECLNVCNDFLSKPSKYKTYKEKQQHSEDLLNDIIKYIDICNYNCHVLTELKEKICAFFYDECISDNFEDCRLPYVKTALSFVRFLRKSDGNVLSTERKNNDLKVISDLCHNYKTDVILMILQNLPNLFFCDTSLNVPFLASEKWAVPDVFKYELLSVFRWHPESYIYGIYIDPVLHCLVLSFLCYQNTQNSIKRNEMLTKMAKYVQEYPRNVEPVAAELPHSLPLHRVYNIVAFCFIKAGRYMQAFNYILNSLELNENSENVAYGYIRCVRLYVKEYILAMLPEDVHDKAKQITLTTELSSRPNMNTSQLVKIAYLYISVPKVYVLFIFIPEAFIGISIFWDPASSLATSMFIEPDKPKLLKKSEKLQEKETSDKKLSRADITTIQYRKQDYNKKVDHLDLVDFECQASNDTALQSFITKRGTCTVNLKRRKELLDSWAEYQQGHESTEHCGNKSRNYDGRFVECIIDKRLEAKLMETGRHNSFEQLVNSKDIPEYTVLVRVKMYISRVTLSTELSEKLILGSIKRQDSLLCRLVLSLHKQLKISISSYIYALESAMNNSEKDHAKAIAWFITRNFVRSHICSLESILDIWPAFVCMCKTNGADFCSRKICIVIEPTNEHVNLRFPNMFNSVEIKLLPHKHEGETEAIYISNRVKDIRNISILKEMSVSGEVAENLFKKHSKLTVINSSLCKSKGYQEKPKNDILEGPCIQLYCRVKGLIPIGEEHFPRHICDLQTDVIEGHSTLMCNIRIGDKIGRNGRFGTLGGFVMARGYPAFLTCCHVIADPESLSQVNMSLGDKEPVQITYFPWYAKQDGTCVRDQEKVCGTIREAPAFETDDPKRVSLDAVLVTIKRKCVTIDKNNLVATEAERTISWTELGMKTEFLNDNCIDYNQFCYSNPRRQVNVVANRATSGYFESSVEFRKDVLEGTSIDLKSFIESVKEGDKEVTQRLISCIKETFLESEDEMQRDMDKYVEDNFGKDMSSGTKSDIRDVIKQVVDKMRANTNLPNDNVIENVIKDVMRNQIPANNASMFGGTHLQTHFISRTADMRDRRRLSRRMYNQLYITGMPFQSGDSGACIYIKEPQNSGCVGMAISNHPGTGCIATPIMEILRHFKIGINTS